MEDLTYDEVAKLFDYDRLEDFLADLGCGDLSIVDVAEKVLLIGKVEEAPKTVSESLQTQEVPQQPALSGDGIFVEGAGNMLTHLSRCCNPMPPDEIIGFVTRGRGVTVHRRDCPNVFRLGGERLIRVDWGSNAPAIMRVKIRVLAWDRAGLLRDITQILDDEKINLEDASASTGGQENRALITATLQVRGADQLSRVLLRIQRIPNVIEVRRQKG